MVPDQRPHELLGLGQRTRIGKVIACQVEQRAAAERQRRRSRTGQAHLLADGYIASQSRHNLGLAVDLTLVDWSVGGREVNMGTPWDTFSEQAHWASATGRTLRYRQLLRTMMEAEGFRQYEKEWWHYSFVVPGPTPAFDVEIR